MRYWFFGLSKPLRIWRGLQNALSRESSIFMTGTRYAIVTPRSFR